MRETTVAMTGTRKLAVTLWTLALMLSSTARAEGGAESIQKTFQPKHLGVAETENLVREMTGLEKVVVDEQAGTIEVEALPETLSEIELLLRIFDNQQPDTASPWEVRVFHLDHLSSREAATLLRSKLLVLELAQNKALDRVAVRDSAERLDAAAKLLDEAGRAGG